MAEIFDDYWWLLFPLAFFLAAGWGSFMRYKRTQAKIDLLKTYAASGKEPPADLIASLDKPGDGRADWSDLDGDDDRRDSHGTGSNAFLVILFAGFAAVFAYEGYRGLIGMGEVAYFVALIFVVLSASFFVASFFKRKS
ncbi:hypothetical protein [Maricaulis sp.]|uniref:hypothetical protein n=1 Tax=Maricaulis sp. TaxID=1486257 RepID=UPI0025DE76E5|nr:hypothetical protein [Maricaulis sp.]MDF1767446.1 hypothetical protein [Maricaulis sp.]